MPLLLSDPLHFVVVRGSDDVDRAPNDGLPWQLLHVRVPSGECGRARVTDQRVEGWLCAEEVCQGGSELLCVHPLLGCAPRRPPTEFLSCRGWGDRQHY